MTDKAVTTLRALAKRLEANGASTFDIWADNERMTFGAPIKHLVGTDMVRDFDSCRVEFFADDSRQLGWALFVMDEGDSVVADFGVNEWTMSVFND